MNHLEELEKWYQSQCNDDWEHGSGVKIESLDNPGWQVKIDLVGTPLQGRPFAAVQVGTPIHNIYPPEWLECHLGEDVFLGAGNSLEAVLAVFLNWAKEAPGAGRPDSHLSNKGSTCNELDFC